MEIIQAEQHTYYIKTGLSLIPFYRIGTDEVILLDSGWAGEREGIDEVLSRGGFKVAGIICTHGHIDHVGNNSYFQAKYGAVTAMPEIEAVICSSITTIKANYMNFSLREILNYYGDMITDTDLYIKSGDSYVDLCGIRFPVVHLPGHSPDLIGVVTPDDVMYLGDALVGYELMDSAKLPYTFLLSQDLRSKESLKQERHKKYIVSHKEVFDEIGGLVEDNIRFYRRLIGTVADIIEAPMGMDEIVREVFLRLGIKRRESVRKFKVIERSVNPYLDYLLDHGILSITMQDGLPMYSKRG